MDLVTHLPRTLRAHDAVWVIVDRLTKSTYFLAVRMTFTLEELCRLYMRDIVCYMECLYPKYRIGILGSRHTLEELSEGHGDTVDYENCISSANRWSVGDDHTDF